MAGFIFLPTMLCVFAPFAVKRFYLSIFNFGNPGPPESPVLAFWGGISAILAILSLASSADKGFGFDLLRAFLCALRVLCG
jgi:hypothetical protein